MSQANELLNGLSNEELTRIANPEIEPHIVVDSDRFISVPDELKRIAVQYDKDIETVTFDCPRYWDDIDLSKMTVYINYQLPNSTRDSYMVKDVTIDENDPSIMHFTWTISDKVTAVDGKITINITARTLVEVNKDELDPVKGGVLIDEVTGKPYRFYMSNGKLYLEEIEDIDEPEDEPTDEPETVTVFRCWNSESNSEMYVSKGMNCIEAVINENPDLATQLLHIIDSAKVLDPMGDGLNAEIHNGGDKASAAGDYSFAAGLDTTVPAGNKNGCMIVGKHGDANTHSLFAVAGGTDEENGKLVLDVTVDGYVNIDGKLVIDKTGRDVGTRLESLEGSTHSHDNKEVLDQVTQTHLDDIHTHSNEKVLEGITSDNVASWDNASTNSHTHSNKTVLDGITSGKIESWDNASSGTFTNGAATSTYRVDSGKTLDTTPQFRNIIIATEEPTDISTLAIGDLIFIVE